MNTKAQLRFAFYVSGNASRLLKVIEQFPLLIGSTYIVINDEAPNEQLSKQLAERKVEYIEFSYKEKGLKGKDKNTYISNLLLQKFNENKIDYSFCFGSRILTGELLNVYRNRIINFHPAVLPMFPGVKSIDQALQAKASILGNTAHFVDAGTDTGPVIMQSTMHAKKFKDYEDVLSLQLPMINQIFCWINEGRIVVEDNKVKILNADYNQTNFYPELENK